MKPLHPRRKSLLAGAAVVLFLVGGCPGRELQNPARLTLVNRSGVNVTGVLLKFDRDVVRVDRVSVHGFDGARLRLEPPDTLRLEGGELGVEEAVTYEVTGKGGAPTIVEGRWIVDGEFGAKVTDREIR